MFFNVRENNFAFKHQPLSGGVHGNVAGSTPAIPTKACEGVACVFLMNEYCIVFLFLWPVTGLIFFVMLYGSYYVFSQRRDGGLFFFLGPLRTGKCQVHALPMDKPLGGYCRCHTGVDRFDSCPVHFNFKEVRRFALGIQGVRLPLPPHP